MPRQPQNLPPYRRYANEIIERIRSGELRPGDPVPSTRDMVRDKGFGMATASRVLGVLRDEGWIDTVPGHGSLVRERDSLTQGADRLSMLRRGGDGFAENETVEILPGRAEPASQEIADALGIEAGTEVAMRRRRYSDAAGVSAVSSTWISAELAAELPEYTSAEPLPKMTFGLIEDRTGRRVVKRRDTISVRPAPEDIAADLGVEPGREVLVLANRYWDQHGEPTEYAVDYHAPGRELVKEVDLG
ncbi:GntR family transcriptional regulator [Streptomyces sp. NPDC004787]|uniref:GntR family transcriptional regulator n=1 Tax=Streptomyces sp. NPDC004787 TaxID=3154291 RepID=UPI0033BEC50B